uniref:3-hydroxyisobutyryl-CoA hydrolase n=1 Tax=Bursaphelenchus xylophilus TaxID=6326 RepID=A0A1I7SG22_BURXY
MLPISSPPMSLFVRRSHQSPLWLSLRSCSQKKEKKKVEPPKLDEPLGREIYRENQVVRLVLNSPKNRNALSLELMKTLREELSQIDKINKVRAVILAGEGPAFSAGHDLRQLVSGV